ncbi:DNA-binding protein [Permianibacter aggregans]|nr:DNA-binding protein [Permianibacter aggregans]
MYFVNWNIFSSSDTRQLHEQRQTVTVDRVRGLLGRGSRTTLLKHLQRWREQSASTPEFSLGDIPPQMLSLVEALWRNAGEHAHALLEKDRQQLNQMRNALTDAERVKEGQVQALTAQLATYQQREHEMSKELLHSKEALARLDAEHSHMRQLFEASKQGLQEREQQIKALQKELADQSTSNLQRLRSEQERYESDVARWLVQLDETRQMLRKMTERCTVLEKQLPNQKTKQPNRAVSSSKKTARGNATKK